MTVAVERAVVTVLSLRFRVADWHAVGEAVRFSELAPVFEVDHVLDTVQQWVVSLPADHRWSPLHRQPLTGIKQGAVHAKVVF